jgi:hypothetical protein
MALEKFVKALDATDEVDLTVTGRRIRPHHLAPGVVRA